MSNSRESRQAAEVLPRIGPASPSWGWSYWLLLRWSTIRFRYLLPTFTIVQTAFAAAMVLGFALLVPTMDDDTAERLSAGAWTLGTIAVGLVVAPQTVSVDKQDGVLDYQRAMPVSRTVIVFADATVWVLGALPGVIAGIITAALRFDLDLRVSGWAPVAVLLVILTSVSLGYALAYALPPAMTGVATQLVILLCLLFSPLTVSEERLPDWLISAHEVLPFSAMGRVIRHTLLLTPEPFSLRDVLVLGAWAVVGLVATNALMSRRQ